MTYAAPQVDYSVNPSIEDQAWFLVFVAVLLALGATVVLGAAVWCVVNGNGSFTGSVQWVSGLKVNIECRK
ncbi:hypothetical protein ACG2QI_14410 [Bacillus sp. GM2]|uniref:Uncharacterized protein n=1 Tax=Bacillus paralicheniformis TaxID=1648923 RepID=A0A6I7TWD4_9BACI|nr:MULTISPECIES: hypothetical protein [Bacillus]ETB70635.1 hypothetical protein A943_11205 [Bacillus sp. CPSM8]KJD54396.1 hypothetical protein UZ38_27645 [Bacillus amyloliquefaciens]KUL08808.1 hypothetical protein LI7559_13790 [Bacillus licheniformis LMG 7559]KUL15594.1 hypothetical protein LI6934_19475 [Bacillus licheniformis LMG 6934]MBC8624119.1 hypothetical protein [Robertmurraya crescens]POO83629.1 hypothetical protein C1T30_09785 [Bacillus sp. MBGLi97]TWK27559.1 hypothetical protein CH